MCKCWVKGGSALFAKNGNVILPNQLKEPLLVQFELDCQTSHINHHIAVLHTVWNFQQKAKRLTVDLPGS